MNDVMYMYTVRDYMYVYTFVWNIHVLIHLNGVSRDASWIYRASNADIVVTLKSKRDFNILVTTGSALVKKQRIYLDCLYDVHKLG